MGRRSMYKFYSSNVRSDKGTWVGCNTWLGMFILARELLPTSHRWQWLDFPWAGELTWSCMKTDRPKSWERLLWGKTWLRRNWKRDSRTTAMFSTCRGQRRKNNDKGQSQDRYSTCQVCCKTEGQGLKKKPKKQHNSISLLKQNRGLICNNPLYVAGQEKLFKLTHKTMYVSYLCYFQRSELLQQEPLTNMPQVKIAAARTRKIGQ